MNIDILQIRDWIIAFIYIILFGTSAFEKLKSTKIPSWFNQQFDKTFLKKFPLVLKLSYWKIAIFEALITILFLASIFQAALLPYALVLAMLQFAVLCFGLRISFDYQGSANMFTYFGASLVALFIVMHH